MEHDAKHNANIGVALRFLGF